MEISHADKKIFWILFQGKTFTWNLSKEERVGFLHSFITKTDAWSLFKLSFKKDKSHYFAGGKHGKF